MPLLAVNLAQVVLSGIKELIDSGKYESLESFIEVASFNQLALERSGGSRLKSDGLTVTTTLKETERKKRPVGAPKKRGTAGKIERQVYLLDRPDIADDVEAVVMPFSRMLGKGAAPKPFAMMKTQEPADHIFGQVNRLFPMKLICRWVMRVSHTKQQWPSLAEVTEGLGDDAARLGSLLEQQDLTKDRKRDDCLATGLPRRGNGPSKDRFVSQFIARVTRAGHIFPGALCQYKLASVQDQMLTLSQRGVDFAVLENPLIDGRLNASTDALSREETQFLLSHILQWVPQEQADFQTIIGAIATGASTPTTLTAALRPFVSSDWNEGEIQTHLSGLIARMSELGLLRRRWHGRHVEYELLNPVTPPKEKIREAG